MRSASQGSSDVSKAAWLVALVAIYVATGIGGLHVAALSHAVTLFWPPTGIAIAAVILFGWRTVPLVALSSFVVSFVATRSAAFAISTAVGNSFEALVSAMVFARLAEGRRDLGRPRDAAAFAVAAIIGCTIAASVGGLAVSSVLRGFESDFPGAFRIWWLGDLGGAVLVTPAVLALASPADRSPFRGSSSWSGPLVVALAIGAAGLQFMQFSDPTNGVPLAIVQLVVIVAATFRFGTRGAHLSALLICTAAVLATVRGRGPYAAGDPAPEYTVLFTALSLAAGAALFVSSFAAEREAMERRVITSEERLRALFENAPSGILLLDSSRRVVLANPAALTMSGRAGFDDGDALRLLIGDDSGELREALRRAVVRGERMVESTMKHTDREGRLREFVVRTTMIGSDRAFGGAVVLVEDVTEQEAARKERERIDQQLSSAQRLDSIGNLAGGIAHDFNNMLQAIQANLELAQIGAGRAEDPRPGIQRALSAAERAAALTRQLLAFSRRQPASYGRVDVLATLRSSLALVERLLPEDIHLLFDPRATDLVVRGDQAQIEQVVLNLVVNARDAMPQGGTLRVELDAIEASDEADGRPDDAPSGLVCITVSDEGPGIDDAIRDRVFEPFFTTKPTGQGTGLGLSVVYGIAKSHGGSVRVENREPRGARFTVEFPRLEGATVPSIVHEDAGVPEGHGERILLVEDDAMVRTAVRDMLVASGYEVVIASNGADAVAKYVDSEGGYDLVMLDVVMPVMGGREAYERLRQIDPDVGVLFATGYSEEQIDVGFVVREQVPVLTKPYDRGSLLRAIAQIRSRRAA